MAASLTAVFKKNDDIAIGNIVGSNIFNILLVLGVTSLILPIPFQQSWNIDILFLFGATLLMFGFMFIRKRMKLDRWNGVLFLVFYAVYIAFLLIRG